jgi:hypothetical protein
MNQNELRIGNLLHYKLFADNISVRGIGKNCINLYYMLTEEELTIIEQD